MSDAAYARRTRRRPVSRGGGSGYTVPRFVPVVGIVVASAGFIAFLAVVAVFPALQISRIYVHADFEISREDLLDRAGFREREYWFSVQTREMANRISAIPMVRTAHVERVFPNALRLTLERRRPLALVLIPAGGRLVPAAVDEQGVIFTTPVSSAELDLPIISGIEFQGSVVGSRLPDMVQPFLESLYRLRVDSPRLFQRISEFRVVPRRTGGYDLLMYIADYRIPVRLESQISTELSTWSLMVLDVLAQQGLDGEVAEVDVRSGEIVYRLKEDSHGR